ncbi:hypothetical protein [Hydrogenimonas cancrithermarum]|uniref:Uncharacterized protein n=1 Tax=Hydrogenimonas cancrithermarum TaxID=2993563 RepID=A0ABM8FNE1_9BACT|nr:hypothetical protein [Hydrogenimonas cancrithermarum]BDY13367.1 hypothetical protein HCR_16790 [Hydrogenimonas cancrithermarum]
MFSTMHNQSRASELIERARSAIESASKQIKEAKDRLVEEISKSDSVKERLSKKSLTRFQKLAKELHNEPPLEITPVSETLFIEQAEPLLRQSEAEPPQIVQLRQKKGGAFFAALFAALVTVAAALLIGALGTALPLTLDTFSDPNAIERILAWIGGGAFDPEIANPLWGAAGLAVAAITAALITWSITLSKTARHNLDIAESLESEAEAYGHAMRETAETMEEVAEALRKYRQDLEICDAFVNEFNASIQRILLTEGNDFEAFKPASKRLIERASEAVTAMIPLLNIAILTTENRAAEQLLHAVEALHELVENLIEERPLKGEAAPNEPIILGYTKENNEEASRPEEGSEREKS